MITVIGKLADTAAYLDREGYNVYPRSDDWTPEKGRAWITEAVVRGDTFKLVSDDFSGVYLQEIRWLLAEATKLRVQAGTLTGRAAELEAPVRRASQLVRERPLELLSDAVRPMPDLSKPQKRSGPRTIED